jgi:hypothetical protein
MRTLMIFMLMSPAGVIPLQVDAAIYSVAKNGVEFLKNGGATLR